MEKGKIIFLNGVSSTGKSTLSRSLQKQLDEPYHWLNVDNFMMFTDMSQHPAKYFEPGKDPVSIFPHVVKLYADLGINVIADVAFMKWQGPQLFLAEEALHQCIAMLHDYPLLYVHVTCPYKEVQRRHNTRGDRSKGKSLDIDYHEDDLVGDLSGLYDLTVNTHELTMAECVNRIIRASKHGSKSPSFLELWSKR